MSPFSHADDNSRSMTPSSSGGRLAPTATQEDEAYDELTDLYLDEPTDKEARNGRRGSKGSHRGDIELVCLEGVEGASAGWVRQHTTHLAQDQGGPVLLVLVRDGTLTVEQLGEASDKLIDLDSPDDNASIQATLQTIHGFEGTLVISAENVDPVEVVSRSRSVGVTLLADVAETHVVSAYRSIKRLHEKTGATNSLTIQLVAGSRATYEGPLERLREAVDKFLAAGVTVKAGPESVEPSQTRRLLQVPCDLNSEDVLRLIIEGEPENMPAPAPSQAARADSASSNSDREDGDRGDAEAKSSTRSMLDEPVGFDPLDGPLGDSIHASLDRSIDQQVFAEARNTSTSFAENTASSVPMPAGLTALGVDDPYRKDITIACDDQGSLHIIAHAIGRQPSEAIAELLASSGWAADHIGLLAAASGGRLRRDTGAPKLHVVAGGATDFRLLVDAGIGVHLCVPTGADTVTIASPWR